MIAITLKMLFYSILMESNFNITEKYFVDFIYFVRHFTVRTFQTSQKSSILD